jgi:hypothetical protein
MPRTRPEITGRKITLSETAVNAPPATGPPLERCAFTIAEFCVAHRISESFFYKIRNMGLGPRETRKGEKVTISIEAARDWRNPDESAASQPTINKARREEHERQNHRDYHRS